MERIKLNLIPSGVAPVVHVSQYDDGREFAIDLYEGENVYVLDGTETLTVNVRKPDGHLVVETVTNTSDSFVVVATTEQMTAVHGTNYAKLQIVKGGVTIATLEFLMNVSRDPLENGDPSESFVDNLETQIALAVADQYDSANVVFDANPTSGHGTPYTVTSEGIKTAIDNGTITLKTIDNVSIASFSDGADNIPVKNLEVDIQYKQASGTPTPSNPLPITTFNACNLSVCGVNIWNEDWESGDYDSSGNKRVDANRIRSKNPTPILPNTTYYLVATNYTGTNRVLYYDKDGNVLSPWYSFSTGTFTTPANAYYMNFFMTASTYNNDISINYPSTDTTYHAYNGQTYNIPFGQTVAKGTLNVTTGELTITHGVVDLGSLTWTYYDDGTIKYFHTVKSDMKVASARTIKIACSIYQSVTNAPTYADTPDKSIYNANVGGNYSLCVKDFDYTDAATFKTAMNGIIAVYELATPTVVQLSATEVKTLLGNNNIYADTGDINTLTYYVDTNALNLVTGLVDKYGVQADWNENDSSKADYIQNKPTIPTNSDFSLSGLSDTDISGETSGQVLAYDGANWVNTNQIVVKYEEKDIAFDSSGEGTLYYANGYILGLKDIPSDSLYIGYVTYMAGTKTMVKGFNRSATSFDSTSIANTTRKIGIYYLDYITTE